MKIRINKNPQGLVNNFEFAVCQFIDGCVRLFSLGLLYTDLPLIQTRNATKRTLKKRLTRT